MSCIIPVVAYLLDGRCCVDLDCSSFKTRCAFVPLDSIACNGKQTKHEYSRSYIPCLQTRGACR